MQAAAAAAAAIVATAGSKTTGFKTAVVACAAAGVGLVELKGPRADVGGGGQVPGPRVPAAQRAPHVHAR